MNHAFDHLATHPNMQIPGPNAQRRGAHANSSLRSPLARLRADEVYLERRKYNVQNYGSSWIKPPGIFKSLHQLREERREMEEHQEAIRREQLAQELAEAEAGEELRQSDLVDGEIEQLRDLDDDIPEADTTGLDLVGADSDSADSGSEDDNVPSGVLAQRIPEDAYREALVRGEEAIDFATGPESQFGTDEDAQSQILREEDLHHRHSNEATDMGMMMNADLDDDVPEADAGGYEHTDTEAEFSSSEDDNLMIQSSHPLEGQRRSSRSNSTQQSLGVAIGDTRYHSSIAGSSPVTARITASERP